MLCMNEKDQERSAAVLRQLEGMTIADAQELLQWCGNRLLDQPVLKWGFVDDKGKLCGDPEKHEGGSV